MHSPFMSGYPLNPLFPLTHGPSWRLVGLVLKGFGHRILGAGPQQAVLLPSASGAPCGRLESDDP
jgi:hypothetical protein